MKKGEVWLVELPTTNGHEQTGTRPVIVLADTEANVAIAVPLTSNLQALRFLSTIEIKPSKKNGLSAVSVALTFQLRAIDKKRIRRKIGEIEDHFLQALDAALTKLLNLSAK
ncbi:type II toxin-antitoxin system PemK/MazF family toxin [Candidatus Woesearchaeota archaeon]|nr:type II toxin-antitoxin system PemK/MazF family toxin [Candidatus Woesearchaeota archaeon]